MTVTESLADWKFLAEPCLNALGELVYWKAVPISITRGKQLHLVSWGDDPEMAVFNARRRVLEWEETHNVADSTPIPDR